MAASDPSFSTSIGSSVQEAASWLLQDDVVGIPTETVYGLAGNALSEVAVAKIFTVKNRPTFNPLIAHIGRLEDVHKYAQTVPALAEKLIQTFWPGPLTLLLKKTALVPDLVTAGSDYVALRMPDHALTLELLKTLPFPLAAPSANPFMYVSPTEAEHVYKQLKGKLPYILNGGACTIGVESTIVGFDTEGKPVLYRAGGITVEQLEEVVGPVKIPGSKNEAPLAAPGQLKKHYATGKPMQKEQTAPIEWLSEELIKGTWFMGFDKPHDLIPSTQQILLAPDSSLSTAAASLFSTMRKLDEIPEVERIIVGTIPTTGLGRAINDRLRRALHL